MPIIKLSDQPELVDVKQFPEATYLFEKFNPVQSRVYEHFTEDCNMLIATATSSGKTVCAELFFHNEMKERKGKAMYIAPLKALAQEKIDDWTDKNNSLSKYKLSICTGDFRLTPERKKELEEADIIIMTPEMLTSRCRNFTSEHNEWLYSIGTIVLDEFHLLTVPDRGDNLEVGLMKLSQISPKMRIVGLSATMPNVEEIAEWLVKLNSKQTYLLESKYRPCPLGVRFCEYTPESTYEDTEQEKVKSALEILNDNKEDRFLMFVHTKKTGELLKKEILSAGYNCEFHNADLDKNKRNDIENRFKKGDLHVVIATSTLAWGLNLPARRVVIVGVHRGMSEVETYDIWQMAGRAGRPGYDPRGDVYILLPDNQSARHMKRLQTHQPITSRLLDKVGESYKTLAFHLISEIHHGGITNKKDIRTWYERTLARFQAQDLNDHIIDLTIEALIKCGAVKLENNIYVPTTVGVIASMFFYSPFDVADLRRNFNGLFKRNLQDEDLVTSICLGNIDSLKMGIVSKDERRNMSHYMHQIKVLGGENEWNEPAMKGGYCYYLLMNGLDLGVFANTGRSLQWDFSRLIAVLNAIDSMSCKWNKKQFFKKLQVRMVYGVKEHLVELCGVAEIGKARATKLWAAGIKNPNDIILYQEKVSSILNVSKEKIAKILESAAKV